MVHLDVRVRRLRRRPRHAAQCHDQRPDAEQRLRPLGRRRRHLDARHRRDRRRDRDRGSMTASVVGVVQSDDDRVPIGVAIDRLEHACYDSYEQSDAAVRRIDGGATSSASPRIRSRRTPSGPSDETADVRTATGERGVFQFTAPAIATAPIQSVFVPSTLPSVNSTTPQSRSRQGVRGRHRPRRATGATFDVEREHRRSRLRAALHENGRDEPHALAPDRPHLPVRGSCRERQLRARRVRAAA